VTVLPHLIAHDLRVHGPLFAAWAGIVVAHPLVAILPWHEDAVAFGWVLAAALVAARILLTVMLVAGLVQADSPNDDSAFWRTRPIRPATMAAAKLSVALAVFVGIPLIVVLSVALALDVRVSHWPASSAGVVLGEAPLVLAAVIAAALTRRMSTAVVALTAAAGVLAIVETSLLDAVIHYRPWLRLAETSADFTWMAAWVGTWLFGAAIAVWWRATGRPAAAIASGASVIGVFFLWLLPATYASAGAPDGPQPTVTRLDVWQVGHGVKLGAAITHPFGGDAAVSLSRGLVTVGSHEQVVDTWPLGRSLSSSERLFSLLDLSPSAVAKLQGAPVTVTAHVVGAITRHRLIATLPLAVDARVDSANLVGTIDRVYQPTDEALTVADVTATFLRGTGLAFEPITWSAIVTDRQSGRRRQLLRVPNDGDDLRSFLRLPILARPFERRHQSLRAQGTDLRGFDATARIEVVAPERETSVLPVTATLPMPGLPGGIR